ncbi:MAG: hypothetical protein OXN88_07065 [Chloroflexota bacterium]|nr:hypothetical protein [Chloroflexota bacterium]
MDAARIQRHFVAVMAKHLPPSSANLQLLDLDGRSGGLLAEARADLNHRHIPAKSLADHDIAPGAFDAIVAYDVDLSGALLASCFAALRAGGRLIALQSRGAAGESHLRRLRERGFVRILVEPALDEIGVLIRGERPQVSADTMERIQSVAQREADSLPLAQFKGRYIHLLVQRQPNKPVWKLDASEKISWRAAALRRDPLPALLGFSSLPKAVGFMQPAVLAGLVRDINKVGKFSLATVESWDWGLVLNPAPDSIEKEQLTYIELDPATAEAPDE